MIDNPALETILETATDISLVCELYSADAVPSADGFDPVDAIDCFAAVNGITFRTRDYKRLVTNFGNIKRSITEATNNTSVTFANKDRIDSLGVTHSREIAQFEFTNGFEGLILVIRLISRSLSVALTDSQILFAGRCEKPKSGDDKELTVTAKFILDSQNVTIPRRRYTREDYKGREPSDPEFEGFIFMEQSGSTVYSAREKRGGLLGLLGFKKTVKKTLQYSSYSAIDENKGVPVVFGYAQIIGTHIGVLDVGTTLQIRDAFCDGPIADIINPRSLDTRMPLSATNFGLYRGEVGVANASNPAWVAPGTYSRTAHIEVQGNNSALDVVDPAPDVAAVVKGMKLMTPDGGGAWTVKQWTDNPAAVIYYLLVGTDIGPDYYALDENWLDLDTFNETYQYNAEPIFNSASSDYLFLD